MSFHSYDHIIDDVSWITTTHYSGIFGLMKLALNKVLPKDLRKVIVLDTDIALASDISQLWKLFEYVMLLIIILIITVSSMKVYYLNFSDFDPDNALGLVENQVKQ